MSAKKTCVFCGEALQGKGKGTERSRKTDEHITPKWLIEHLAMGEMPITGMRWDVPSRTVIEQHRHGFRSFVSGRVCAGCNNGWMSDLETEAKPILIRLIADPRVLPSLSEAERHTVARWTLKTAVVLNQASFGDAANPLDRPIPVEHRKLLASGIISDELIVVGAGCPSGRVSEFLQSASWASPKNTFPLRKEDRECSYKVGMSFNSLLLAVAYYPNNDYYYGITADRFAVLWEGTRGIVRTDAGVGEVPIASNSPILEGFLGNIFVVSKAWWTITQNAVTTRLIVVPGRSRR